MQLRRKSAIRFLASLCALVVFAGTVPSVGASPRSVIRSTRRHLAETKEQIAKRNRELARVRAQLEEMDIDLALAVERYNGIRMHLRETERDVSVNLGRLARTNAALEASRELLNERVVNIYKHGKAGAIDVVLNTDGFDDFLVGIDLLRFIATADSDMVVRIDHAKRRVKAVQDALLEQRQRQRVLRDKAEAQKERIEEGIRARRGYVARLGRDIQSLLARRRRQEARIAAEQARLAAAAARSRRTAGSNGGSSRLAVGSGGRQDVVRIAMSYLGVPYVWGGESRGGVDCSGLVLLVYREIGISLPHHSASQWGYGRSVSRGELVPGDLVFFSRGGAGSIYHVAIYVGSGSIIEAPFTGANVWIKSLGAKSNYFGARRLL